MTLIRKIYESVKNSCIKYPAIISGIFIYTYLLFCIVHYFVKVKYFPDSGAYFLENIVDSFDAFPFMWLLSVVLVKIIEIRTKLHQSEEQRIIAEQEMNLRQTQLKTLHEITRGIQHHINNPLSVIVLSIGKAQKEAENNQIIVRHLRIIEDEVNRIIAALSDFSKVNTYSVESIDPHIGNMTARGTIR